MILEQFSTGAIDWSNIPAIQQTGESGTVTARSHQLGGMQLRVLDYSSGYVSNHWCRKGHIVFVIAGSFTIEHQDGRRYVLAPGACYHVPDDEVSPHRGVSESGATVFIVD